MTALEGSEIYLDYAATAPPWPEVVREVSRCMREEWGNSLSVHRRGQRAAAVLEEARARLAEVLRVAAETVTFTSGATEANNWALRGVVEAARQQGIKKPHLVISAIEHASVRAVAEILREEGQAELSLLPVDDNGLVRVEVLPELLRPQTVLVSVMWANNEIGTIQPLAKIARAIKAWKKKEGRKKEGYPYFHSDAAAAFPWLSLSPGRQGVGLLTVSAHKIGGPKGCGALVVQPHVLLPPLLRGGGQEGERRAGTVPVCLAHGFAVAGELITRRRSRFLRRVRDMRDYLWGQLRKLPGVHLNGSLHRRLVNNLNVWVEDVPGAALLQRLDLRGVAASLGSACTTGALEESHVVRALGRGKQAAAQSLRLTLGWHTRRAEVTRAAAIIQAEVSRLRQG